MQKSTTENETERIDAGTTAPTSLKGRRLLNLFLSLLIIVLGLVVATYVTHKAPKAQKRAPVKVIPVVEVQVVQPGAHRIMVPAMGTVVPAREVVLKAQVSGKVLSLHPEFIEGGYIKENAEILQIDPEDYELTVTLAEAKVKDAESGLELAEEEANAAKEEWRLLYKDDADTNGKPPPLAAKEPQLAAAQARLKAEQAELKKAELDLKRTSVRAPFNGIVRTKSVEVGSLVTPQDALAELLGVDEYWIQVSVPVDYLRWISVPKRRGKKGSEVRVVHQSGYERSGEVIELLGDLESEGRMARILVAVKDPLGLQNSGQTTRPLLIGEYVRVEVEGSQLTQVFRIPRIALREDNTVWLVGEGSTLNIRPVTTIWRDTQTVFLDQGLNPGDQVIVSDLAAPVEGMKVQVESADKVEPARSAKTGSG
ncbi:MAG: efflux RND transporter periplasmic adaptor subunit [Syntrophobacteria bacterium]|jgi:RND family efflux transporter MFP subunit|nr:efflux RND transporter periplasmic adaptor subunit [Deltaproteobacteria bacterium]MDH3849773.1 efflux RND transporter periplasmic adaptor subunit [Deltaproteobacteria bacterium]MDH3897188.1 efflux RND transporter periplasmic adaptor subunit [Deltaproteobacteria bacterium]MDH3929581.1 efflux RND transporter periplasmic adaptor subunit [Deltaproteobacteria bacterium]MDH3949762.1 efflux RND transporter periplasmic adaptor subunit [Deltaproteobacteria bacterium]